MWLQKLTTLVSLLFKTNGHREGISFPSPEKALRENLQLTEHFSLYELTVTANASLQSANRALTDNQIDKLKTLGLHAETIRSIASAPILIHSGYRCDRLNGVTPGSSSTSQHPRCEAIDFEAVGKSVEDTFTELLSAARRGEFKFGQLIVEQSVRDYGVVKWVHCSVIGSLDPQKVGQVMKMVAGEDGHLHYTLVDKLEF